MECLRLEEVASNAWPALQQLYFDGWILKISKGYTKRANSINLLYPSSLDTEQKTKMCEKIYKSNNQPPIFRLTSFFEFSNLDDHLDTLEYKVMDPTQVMTLDLKNINEESMDSLKLQFESLTDWLRIFCQLSETNLKEHDTHQKILRNIIPKTIFASLKEKNGEIVSCGLGVLEGEYFGLFDLVTNLQQRRKGYGLKLVSSMLRWAKSKGATKSYLQVTEKNKSAGNLYTKLGFQKKYTYWYRVPSDF